MADQNPAQSSSEYEARLAMCERYGELKQADDPPVPFPTYEQFLEASIARLWELLGEVREKAAGVIGPGLLQDIGDVLGETPDWRCECGDLNRHHEAFCYRCGAGHPEDA